MALNPSKGGSLFQQAIERQIARQEAGEEILGPEEMAAELANAYFEYSKDAVLPGADMTAGGDVSILEKAFIVSDSSATSSQLSTGLGAYWATCGVPGIPAHGGTAVASVVISGPSSAASFFSEIQGSITDKEVDYPFTVFFSNLEKAVGTIACVVTELMPPNGTPTPFPETIT